MLNKSLSTPIVFIIFNRPDTTRLVFEAIRNAKPQKLFVIADGARPHKYGELQKCLETREIIKNVDWDCEVLINFSDTNMGCKKRISSGLDWVFTMVDEAIILEDDCLPHPSFFNFCHELLDYYKDDHRVMMISGDNFMENKARTDDSYYFSMHTHIWGWATWKRAWSLFDSEMTLWPHIRDRNWLYDVLQDQASTEYWYHRFEDSFTGKVNSWAYPWTFSCWVNRGLTILPNRNLISNIGFGDDATNTVSESPLANIPTEEMSFPLVHPPYVIRDSLSDDATDRQVFLIKKGQPYLEVNLVAYYKSVWLDHLIMNNHGIAKVLTNQQISSVVIFGTGQIAMYLLADVKREGITVEAFLDNDTKKQGTFIEGIPIVSVESLGKNQFDHIDAILVSIEGMHDQIIISDLTKRVKDKNIEVISWKDLARRSK